MVIRKILFILCLFFLVLPLALTSILVYSSSNSTSIYEWKMYGRTLDGNRYYPDFVDITEFRTLWTREISIDNLASLTIINNTIFVLSKDSSGYKKYIIVLNSINGTTMWNYTNPDRINTEPITISGSMIYFGGGDKIFRALYANNGSEVWNFTLSGTSGNKVIVVEDLVITDGGGVIYALNATNGKQVWNQSSFSPNAASPVVANGIVYMGVDDKFVHAFNLSNGEHKWNYSIGKPGFFVSPAIANGIVYIGSDDHNFYALNATSPTQIWNYTTGGRISSSPAIANGIVYIGSNDNNLYALNATNSNQIWNYTLPSDADHAAAITNDVVFIGAGFGFFALNSTTGKHLWEDTAYLTQGSPAISDGVVYNIGNGKIVAHIGGRTNDTAQPNVSSSYPADGQMNVSVKINVTINFSEKIDTNTLQNIIIKDQNGNQVKGALTYDDNINQTVFNPSLFLRYNTTYIISLNTSIKDIAGKSLVNDITLKFTTEFKDTDRDGIPDYLDSDIDNDGVNDTMDFVRGNISNINTNLFNLITNINNSQNLSKFFGGINTVKFYQGNITILEFDFNFSSDKLLDFTNISILNESNSTTGGTLISGISLIENFKKTAYVEKVNTAINGLCIKDEDIDSISEISNSCNGTNEFKVECDGSTQNGYSCTYNSTSSMYKVTGLSHSGVMQLAYTQQSSGDSSGGSSGGGGSSSGGGGSGGGGGGGGGGGLGYVCNMEWQCSSWSECRDGWQTRECNFVKVAQHVQKEPCEEQSKIPETSKKCETKQPAASTSSNSTSTIKENQKLAQNASNTTPKNNNSNSITGGVVAGIASKSNVMVLATLAIISIAATIFYKKFRKRK